MLYLYLDESGDLGFDFIGKKPSRFFNVTVLLVKGRHNRFKIVQAVKKTLKRKMNHKKKNKASMWLELKASGTTLSIKKYFYKHVADVEFQILSLTLNKPNVYLKLYPGKFPSKSRLYNWVAQLLLENVDFSQAGEAVNLIIDRSKSRKEIHEFNQYLTRHLETQIDPETAFDIEHVDSKLDPCLSAIDLFAWGFFRKYEYADSVWYDIFKEKIIHEELYLA